MNASESREFFIRLVQENQGIINSVCRIYFRDEEDFKDARQDVIFQLWKALPSFRGESKISTWIYRVSLHTMLHKKRQEMKYSQEISLSEAGENTLSIISFADDDHQQLMHIIGQLENVDKAIVILHLEGYSHKEIASTLNFTQTNISTRLNRIKTKLREIYNVSQHESQ